MTSIYLPIFAVASLDAPSQDETRANIVLALRTMFVPPLLFSPSKQDTSLINHPSSLIIPSLTQLVYLNLDDPLPYLITAEVHLALATILSCTTVLPPLTDLVIHKEKDRPWTQLEKGNSSSSSTLGSTGAADYQTTVTGGMVPELALPEYIDTVLVSRVDEGVEVEGEEGLELVRVHANVHVPVYEGVEGNYKGKGKGKGKAPVRPRSPSAHERPDLSLFVQQAAPRVPPAILVRGGREAAGARGGSSGSGSGTGKRVQFDV